MLFLNRATLVASIVTVILVASYFLVNKYNSVIASNEELRSKNITLNNQIAKLGSDLQSSEQDKLVLLSDLKNQEKMFSDHLMNLDAAAEHRNKVDLELKEVFINDQVNKDWRDSKLPIDVKRVFDDATRAQGNHSTESGL